MTSSPLAFVLMPFDPEFEAVYAELIERPLTSCGFIVRRADSLQNQRSILHDIVQGIAKADLVIADVSGLNGNVMYELGLAHGLGKRTVLITRSLSELPFDLRPYKANSYSTEFTEAEHLSRLLFDIGTAVLNDEADFSNPVQDYAPDAQSRPLPSSGQLVTPPSSKGGARSADENAEEDGPGFLELLVAMQAGDAKAGEVGTRIGKAIETVGEQVSAHGQRLEKVAKNLGDKAAAAGVGIARDVAKDLNAYSDLVEPLGAELSLAMADVTRGADAIARDSQIDNLSDLSTSEVMADNLANLEQTMADSYDSVSEFAQTLNELPNWESSLKKASRRAGLVSGDLGSMIEVAQAEFARARSILSERVLEARSRLPGETKE